MKKLIALALAALMALSLYACDDVPASGTRKNIDDTKEVTDNLTGRQPTPTDIDYSLERYNLIRRSYWLTWEQYKDSESPEKQGWAEQAKMRANKTAATYNNYILENSYVWSGNVPKDIRRELRYLAE